MKQALACIFGLPSGCQPTLNQTGRVERRHLVQQDVGQLGLEGVGVGVGREVAALPSPLGDRAGDAADHLPHGVLARRGSRLPAEVLLGDDVGRVLRPRLGELDVSLLERDLVAVADPRVPQLPLDGIERMLSDRREIAADRETVAGLAGVLLSGWCLRRVLHSDLLLSVFRSFRVFRSAPTRPRG